MASSCGNGDDGADHGLETDDDPVNSAKLLTQATAAMDAFVAGL